MATPYVFVSSTWYDLRYIRENLKYLIRTIGYHPILSEEGSVYYDPTMNTAEAAVAEVANSQIFVLIIGGRYGSRMPNGKVSVTNAEYNEAVKRRIPIFALVEQAVLNDHAVFEANPSPEDATGSGIIYPSASDPAIFLFINDVRTQAINNALVPFRDFADIERYLRSQWAAMMHAFLTGASEQRRVTDTLAALSDMNQRIELLSRQILKSVGDRQALIALELYDLMLTSESVRDLAYWGARPSPSSVLVNTTFRSCAKALGVDFGVEDRDENAISSGGKMSRPRFERDSADYKRLRQKMTEVLARESMGIEEFLKGTP